MFGFACRDSEEYEKGSDMPAPIYFSHKILEVLSQARRSANCPTCSPTPRARSRCAMSTQGRRRRQGRGLDAHREANGKGKKYNSGMVKEMIAGHVAKSLPEGWMPQEGGGLLVNPTGNFVVGGPTAIAA